MTPELPRNYEEAEGSLDAALIDTRRVFMANRGIWEAIVSAGPQVSFAHSEGDVDTYLNVADEFLGEIAA
jgi:glutamate-1-semialdehyde 2,1-aminomutase